MNVNRNDQTEYVIFRYSFDVFLKNGIGSKKTLFNMYSRMFVSWTFLSFSSINETNLIFHFKRIHVVTKMFRNELQVIRSQNNET